MTHVGIPSDMYKEHILELYRNPSNYGIIKDATHKSTEYNSVCGDEITIHLLVKNGKIRDAKFSGSGCVISMVSSSLFTSRIKGMQIEDVKKISKDDILKLLKIKVTPARIKCALLPLEAVKKALKENA
jgi:nitrogen fixation NifU-like protein